MAENTSPAVATMDQATAHLRYVLKSQYYAALAMLRQPIEACPDDLWYSTEYTNSFWQLAYHTLYFADLYSMPCEADFRPYKDHIEEVQVPDCIPGPPDPESKLPLLPPPYSKAQVLDYLQLCADTMDARVDALDLWSMDCGFHWYKLSKLEHQVLNIRHIQHGAAQLADRLRTKLDFGTKWVGARKR